ncbi:MAG TPA: hypothetical protein VK971_03790 [Thiohalobacter sp.]|nr:hypothetical protein [Thiohalobacter sp.]
MRNLTLGHQAGIGLLLALLMIATRGHHVATLQHLPSASWAVFFLAGVYLRPAWTLPILLCLAGALDFAAINRGGVSSFCVTPAYAFLLPAYGSLWLAGRGYARRHRDRPGSLLPLTGHVLGGALVCELFSSGGFYFFGGRYADPTLAEFGSRLMQYFPATLDNLVFYVGIALMVHLALVAGAGIHRSRTG